MRILIAVIMLIATVQVQAGMDDVDREKYLKIGESDRMTLKFVKS